MALFSFNCPEHGIFKLMLPRGGKVAKCPQCGSDSKRTIKVGTVRITEVIDNGVMGKSIERPVDIDELITQRNALFDKDIKGDETI